MKSIGAEKSIKQPITGSSIEVYMNEAMRTRVLEMETGWITGTIYLGSAELETIVYAGILEGERYYVFLGEEGRLFQNYTDEDGRMSLSIKMLNDRIGAIIDELLKSPSADVGKLDRNCIHMIRLKRYLSVALKETVEKSEYYGRTNDNLLSVDVLLGCIFSTCNEMLPAYGYHIEYNFQRVAFNYSECSTKCLISLICILLFNTISLSLDGVITARYFNSASQKTIGVEFRTASKLSDTVDIGGLSELAELLLPKNIYPFVLELMVSAEVVKAIGWNILFKNDDGIFTMKVEMPEAVTEISNLQLRANSIESDYTEMLIREFIVDLD